MRSTLRAASACALAAFATAVLAAGEPARDKSAGLMVGLVNAGFEAPQTVGGDPPGWVAMHHVTVDAYAFALDGAVRRSGARSLRITNRGPEPYGAIVQRVREPAVRGRTLRFSGWLRTQQTQGAVLMMQAMRTGVPVAYEHMRASAVKGTTDWKSYTITLAVPAEIDEIEVGAMLFGGGTLWFDDAKLEIVSP
jgi:hypothetical protein